MKKKYYLLTIAVLLVGILSGCGNNSGKDTSQDTSLADIKEKGEIVLGTSADYPPFEWHIIDGSSDEIVGVDIEIAKKLADDLGVKLTIKDMSFDSLFPALNSNDIDMIIAGMVVDEDRLKAADFSDPYIEQGQTILVRKEDANKYKSVEDLRDKKIGSQLGSTQQKYAEENFGAEIVGIPNNNNLIMDLKNGTLDAVFITLLPAQQFENLNENLQIIDLGIPNENGSCVAIRKGSTSLLDEINKSIKNLNSTDQVDNWFLEYQELSEKSAK